MKKIILLSLCLTLLFTLATFAGSQTQNIAVEFNTVNITVKGEPIATESILYNSTTYVPLRAISEKLGNTVTWNQNTFTADISTNIHLYEANELTKKAFKCLLYGEELTKLFIDAEMAQNSLGLYFDSAEKAFNSYFNNLSSANEELNSFISLIETMKPTCTAGNQALINRGWSYYESAIENYNNAFKEMENFIITNNQQYLGNSLKYSNQAYDDAIDGVDIFKNLTYIFFDVVSFMS